jgi:hypothetical protein
MLADAEALVTGQPRLIGRWNLAQILEHLALSMDKSVDGFDNRAPWILRIIGRLLFKRMFVYHRMPAGLTLPGRAAEEVTPPQRPLEDAIEHLRQAVRRLEKPGATHPHPLLGPLSADEWIQTHLRHAELHLSFAIPCAAGAPA